MQNELISGISSYKAEELLVQNGYNELPSAKPKSVFAFLFDIVRQPMIALLVICTGIYFFTGDFLEAGMLSISVLGIVILTIYEERKTEKSVTALKNLSSPRALVIRDGKEKRIPGREVVVTDILILNEGDRVPADAEIVEASNLALDESLLTGESVPVEKTEADKMFSGSLVVKGRGVARVIAVGADTQIGKIGKSLNSIELEETLLQKEVSKAIFFLAGLGIFLCGSLFLIYALTTGQWLEGFLAGLTLAMGILPEEFPIVLTVFMTVGAWRLAKANVLTRRPAVIETLGSATVLCVDKTGTLTKNKMTIEKLFPLSKYGANDLLQIGILASQEKPFDPTEIAFFDYAKKEEIDLGLLYKERHLVKEYPLEKQSMAVVQVWKTDNLYEIAAKGAAETIFDLCRLPKNETEKHKKIIEEYASEGYRILAVATGSLSKKDIPENKHDLKYQLAGFVMLRDPLRPEVKEAVRECFEAGIRVVMITGDHPLTAKNIAGEIGIENAAEVITGSEIDNWPKDRLKKALKNVNVFSRVTPEQKLKIVDALKELGEIVAMTGDGVNDAPALKSAHIGISMGQRGTDVAREASQIVLLDDNFISIVDGIKLGRRIYDNLKKAISYIFTVHAPLVLLATVPVIFKLPLVLLPAHIVFFELLIDPTCTLVFENEKASRDIMKRKPRKLRKPIFSIGLVLRSLFSGLVFSTLTLGVYFYTLNIGWEVDKVRSATFVTMIVSNVLFVSINSNGKNWKIFNKEDSNRPLIIIFVTSLLSIFLTLNIDLFKNIFRFQGLSISEIATIFAICFLTVIFIKIFSFLNKRMVNFVE